MESDRKPAVKPLVLILMGDQWPRALLRAELIERGYEAVGARSLQEGLERLQGSPERGPVRLVVIDSDTAADLGTEGRDLSELGVGILRVLVATAGGASARGSWDRTLPRPVSIGDIVEAVRAMLPLTETGSGVIEE